MGLRPLLPAIALALVAVGAPSSAAPEPEAQPMRGIRGLELETQNVEAKLQVLLTLANERPEALMVRAYRNYSTDELGDPKSKREVTVERLWREVVRKSELPEDLRTSAAEAIFDPSRSDHDVDLDTKGRGSRRKRAQFSLDNPVRDLTEGKDKILRVLADRTLKSLWPAIVDPDILRYDPDNRSTWSPAKGRWDALLKR